MSRTCATVLASLAFLAATAWITSSNRSRADDEATEATPADRDSDAGSERRAAVRAAAEALEREFEARLNQAPPEGADAVIFRGGEGPMPPQFIARQRVSPPTREALEQILGELEHDAQKTEATERAMRRLRDLLAQPGMAVEGEGGIRVIVGEDTGRELQPGRSRREMARGRDPDAVRGQRREMPGMRGMPGMSSGPAGMMRAMAQNQAEAARQADVAQRNEEVQRLELRLARDRAVLEREVSEQAERDGERREREPRDRRRDGPPGLDGPPVQELHRALRELRDEVRDLRGEVQKLRAALDERPAVRFRGGDRPGDEARGRPWQDGRPLGRPEGDGDRPGSFAPGRRGPPDGRRDERGGDFGPGPGRLPEGRRDERGGDGRGREGGERGREPAAREPRERPPEGRPGADARDVGRVPGPRGRGDRDREPGAREPRERPRDGRGEDDAREGGRRGPEGRPGRGPDRPDGQNRGEDRDADRDNDAVEAAPEETDAVRIEADVKVVPTGGEAQPDTVEAAEDKEVELKEVEDKAAEDPVAP